MQHEGATTLTYTTTDSITFAQVLDRACTLLFSSRGAERCYESCSQSVSRSILSAICSADTR
jgi:hypothetical protein